LAKLAGGRREAKGIKLQLPKREPLLGVEWRLQWGGRVTCQREKAEQGKPSWRKGARTKKRDRRPLIEAQKSRGQTCTKEWQGTRKGNYQNSGPEENTRAPFRTGRKTNVLHRRGAIGVPGGHKGEEVGEVVEGGRGGKGENMREKRKNLAQSTVAGTVHVKKKKIRGA